MDINHTRGPWKLYNREVLGRAFDGTWRAICDKVRGSNPVEADANARLIAAAPDIFNALFAARHQLLAVTGLVQNPEHRSNIDRAIRLADAAITQAGGNAPPTKAHPRYPFDFNVEAR